MLTAAVRDLHRAYPGQFLTDVRTSCPALWENNPYITEVADEDEGARIITCKYPLIHQSNQRPYHFIHGFHRHLGDELGLTIEPTEFRGHVVISDQEKGWMSQIEERAGIDMPFWVIVAGGKNDFTIKWWQTQRFQEVVDHFRGKLTFVQVGEQGHTHPALNGVIDLRGKTDLRQLVRLVYHSSGVLCPVTLVMHLAAAVEQKEAVPKRRPCVVVAGGREPVNWAAYPEHQFIHTQGALLCCDDGGCWKARTVPLGDGDPKDDPENLCVDVAESSALPRCMDMISADEVIARIGRYFEGGVTRFLTEEERGSVEAAGIW